ncbi:hypothetical protein SmJEL517_g05135 [Synchytrium microbalum]|uniref:Uncharacterized protein n=1 Tax=Synchytrium microbalum TaxID=1806994 RepID=A0A507C1W1_9FUNG|nr:hypothetical protein SmJEL517_g05135 [Synchytrium microbalum]
MAPCERMTRKP